MSAWGHGRHSPAIQASADPRLHEVWEEDPPGCLSEARPPAEHPALRPLRPPWRRREDRALGEAHDHPRGGGIPRPAGALLSFSRAVSPRSCFSLSAVSYSHFLCRFPAFFFEFLRPVYVLAPVFCGKILPVPWTDVFYPDLSVWLKRSCYGLNP